MSKLNELLNDMMGLNKDNEPKSAVSFIASIINDDGDEELFSIERSAYKPEVYIKAVPNFIIVHLVFKSDYDQVLREFWAALELYGETCMKYMGEDNVRVVSSLTIVPIAYDGKKCLSAKLPAFWTIQPFRPTDDNNCIRLLFENDDVDLYENIDVNSSEIKSAVDKILEAEAARERELAARQAERDEYIEERNRKLEELRHNGQTE